MSTFGILVGGGPAPGINGVIGSAASLALRRGHRVVGCYEGFKYLMEGDTDHVVELEKSVISGLHLKGGSILHTSRANPTRKAENLENVVKSLDSLGVDHLITIGGDDTASSANRVAQTAKGRIKVVHVPKTIDNDLPLPPGVPTFGFETAREHATTVVERIIEDCRTTRRWFIIVMMGRSAGHLAMGAGVSAGAPITLIPEEFPKRPIDPADVVRILEGAVLKRLSRGQPDGVAVVAEGIVSYMDPTSPFLQGVPLDEHGHVRLAEIPIAKLLRTMLGDSLKERGVSIALGEKEVGYELRCAVPTAFDREYTHALGVGAVQTLLDGKSDALITRQERGIVPIPFADIIDAETGKSRVREVDTRGGAYQSALALQDRIDADDLADSRTLAKLADLSGLAPDEIKRRYAPL